MIQKETNLVVADNSGAKAMRVIHVVGSTGKKGAEIGEQVICSVKEAIPGAAIKKKQVVKVVIVRTAKPTRRADGSYIRFSENAGVIIDENNEPKGTRIFGPIARELKDKGYNKIISFAPEVL